MPARFIRLAETGRRAVSLTVDGNRVTALEGDTVLVALLATTDHLRTSEFGHERRAGFCLMGACQDCWVWTVDGERLRACSTTVEDGMAIYTTFPGDAWSTQH